MDRADIGAVAALLRARGIAKAKGVSRRLSVLLGAPTATCFVAEEDARIVGVVLSSFNGFHVFVSHIAVAAALERAGIGAALLEAVVADARRRGAIGLIADSQLTSTTFFFKHRFRLAGAVLMIRDL